MSEKQKITPATEVIPVKLGNDFKLLNHAHNTHCVTTQQYMTVAQLEEPRFWSFVAAHMKHMDRLQVTAKDGSMIAFGLVTFAQGSIVKVKFYEHYDLETVAQPEISMYGYIIRQISPVAGWEIIVEDTGDQLKGEGLPTQNAALIYLGDHMKHKVA